jgi:hypothetical protein
LQTDGFVPVADTTTALAERGEAKLTRLRKTADIPTFAVIRLFT